MGLGWRQLSEFCPCRERAPHPIGEDLIADLDVVETKPSV
jgi:hypothetical protein